MVTSKRPRIVLGALQAFIGIGAVAGGLGLVLDPSGGSLGMPAQWLASSPFTDYLILGLVLLLVNGAGNLAGAAWSFTSSRFCALAGTALGAFLIAWIAAQVWWLGLVHWLQPLYFGLGAAELALGRYLSNSRQLPS